MSNPWDPNSGQEPVAPQPGATPPPPPPPTGAPAAPAPGYADPNYGAAPPPGQYPTPPPAAAGGGGGGKAGKIAAGAVGVLLVGGAGFFAYSSMSGDDGGGPADPEAAVEEVLESVDNEDVLGLLGAIDPGESAALRDNVDQLLGHLKRIEVLDDSFEATGVEGIDISIDFDTVEYETVEIREGLTRVEIVDGDIDFAFNPDELPTGDLIADLTETFGGEGLDAEQQEMSFSFSDLDQPFFLVARDTGSDGWRVSLGYTIAETARIDLGEPDLEDGIEAIGEDSPEAAVEEFVRAFEGDSIDTEELVARLSPSELGALHEYLPTFIGSNALGEQDLDGLEITIEDIGLSADEDGNTALVAVESFEVSIHETNLDETVVVTFDGDCITFDASDAPSIDEDEILPFGDEVCIAEPLDLDEAFDEVVPPGADFPEPPELGEIDFGEFRIATAKVDGEWFIAPINTGLTGLNVFLEGIDREVIDSITEYGESLFQLFFGGALDFDSSDFDFEGPDVDEPERPTTTTVETDEPDEPDEADDPDYSSVTPDPALELSDDDLDDLEFIAEYLYSEPAQAVCAYELMVTGEVPVDEVLRSSREDARPSVESEEIFDDIESVCA